MPRSLSPAVTAQLASGLIRPAMFLRVAFLTETVFLWHGLGPIVPPGPPYDPKATFPYGESWIGMGWLGQIHAVPEVADVVAQNVTLVLSGIPAELVTDAMNAVRQNSIATLWLAFMDGANRVMADPVQIFQGHLDVPTITEGADTCTVSITAENPLIDLNRAPSRRFTDIDQQTLFPGDTGFAQVSLLQDYLTVWPSPVADASGDTTAPPFLLVITPGQTGPVEVEVGATVQLTATETRSDGTVLIVAGPGSPSTYGILVWSHDPSIASVTPGSGPNAPTAGLVTGVTPGMTVVTMMFVQGAFLGDGHNKPSNPATASVTILVTG